MGAHTHKHMSDFSMYQVAIQSNLGNTTTKGTGSKWSYFSGGLICQVWFKNFQYGVVHMR